MSNPCLATDSYKLSHFQQYPKGTTLIQSHIVARGSSIEGVEEVVLFGVQAFVRDHLTTPITLADVDAAEAFCKKHGFEFNRAGWERVVKVHGGMLPIIIRSAPEGTPIPLKEAMVVVENYDEELPWATSYVETLLLSYVWYGSTVATLSREVKKVIKSYDFTMDDPDAEIPFKLHDFGYRGVAAGAAGLGGAAHLINFMGTDTIAGIEFAQKYYGADVCGYSIPASEHSTMTSWGEPNEYDAYKNMVDQYAKPGAIFACVIDSYDIDNALRLWAQVEDENGKTLLERVQMAGATVVLRPDSGDAVETPINVIEQLMQYIGYEVNTKGYRVLPKHVRVIQGDGIDIYDVGKILNGLAGRGISASNIAFGMGGGLLQKVNRDTFKFAMKANLAVIDGKEHDVRKHPKGDPSKASKGGRLHLYRNKVTGQLKTFNTQEFFKIENRTEWRDALNVVYAGAPLRTISFDEIRKNAELK